MKKTRNVLIIVLCLVSNSALLIAQEEETQYFNVHQEYVLPGMEEQYDIAMQNMVNEMKAYNIKTEWTTVSNENGLVYYWQPINSMADLDESFYNEMDTEMGSEKVGELLKAFDGSYGDVSNYVVALRNDLSYQTDGAKQLSEDEIYINNTYYYPKRGNNSEFNEKANAIKELFKENNTNMNYRVYQSGYGVQDSYYMVSISAKDMADYYAKINELNNNLGEGLINLITEIRKLCDKVEVEHTYIRKDMSYILPKQ